MRFILISVTALVALTWGLDTQDTYSKLPANISLSIASNLSINLQMAQQSSWPSGGHECPTGSSWCETSGCCKEDYPSYGDDGQYKPQQEKTWDNGQVKQWDGGAQQEKPCSQLQKPWSGGGQQEKPCPPPQPQPQPQQPWPQPEKPCAQPQQPWPQPEKHCPTQKPCATHKPSCSGYKPCGDQKCFDPSSEKCCTGGNDSWSCPKWQECCQANKGCYNPDTERCCPPAPTPQLRKICCQYECCDVYSTCGNNGYCIPGPTPSCSASPTRTLANSLMCARKTAGAGRLAVRLMPAAAAMAHFHML